MKIELVCALPMYNSSKIGWLALESLCRQKGVNFNWELIILEDGENYMGCEEILKYSDRLASAGCVSIDYEYSSEKIPLATKWKKIAERASNKKSDFLLVAADCYSQPFRLSETHEILKHSEWVNSPLGPFYHIPTESIAIFDQSCTKHPCGLNMATKTNLVIDLPSDGPASGIDGWMFKNIEKNLKRELITSQNFSENWKKGVDTDGFNNISSRRYQRIKSPNEKLWKSAKPEDFLIPNDIKIKLKKLKNVKK